MLLPQAEDSTITIAPYTGEVDPDKVIVKGLTFYVRDGKSESPEDTTVSQLAERLPKIKWS